MAFEVSPTQMGKREERREEDRNILIFVHWVEGTGRAATHLMPILQWGFFGCSIHLHFVSAKEILPNALKLFLGCLAKLSRGRRRFSKQNWVLPRVPYLSFLAEKDSINGFKHWIIQSLEINSVGEEGTKTPSQN